MYGISTDQSFKLMANANNLHYGFKNFVDAVDVLRSANMLGKAKAAEFALDCANQLFADLIDYAEQQHLMQKAILSKLNDINHRFNKESEANNEG